MNSLEIKITGRIPSKKNEIRKGRYGNFYNAKSKETDDIVWQLKTYKFFTGKPIKASCLVNTHSRRQDFLNILQTIFDCIQEAGIITNDRQIQEIGMSAITFVKSKIESAFVVLEELN